MGKLRKWVGELTGEMKYESEEVDIELWTRERTKSMVDYWIAKMEGIAKIVKMEGVAMRNREVGLERELERIKKVIGDAEGKWEKEVELWKRKYKEMREVRSNPKVQVDAEIGRQEARVKELEGEVRV